MTASPANTGTSTIRVKPLRQNTRTKSMTPNKRNKKKPNKQAHNKVNQSKSRNSRQEESDHCTTTKQLSQIRSDRRRRERTDTNLDALNIKISDEAEIKLETKEIHLAGGATEYEQKSATAPKKPRISSKQGLDPT